MGGILLSPGLVSEQEHVSTNDGMASIGTAQPVLNGAAGGDPMNPKLQTASEISDPAT